MRFLSRDEFHQLSSQVWRTWNPKKYKGGIWWKFEDILDVSFILERPFDLHSICQNAAFKTQYIPFGKFVLKPKIGRVKSRASTISYTKGENIITRTGALKDISCVALACCKSSSTFVALDSSDNLYFFDLEEGECWYITRYTGVEVLSFCHKSRTEVMIGKKDGVVDKISVDPEIVIGYFTQHIFPVEKFLFFSDDVCLSYSKNEAWIWNCFTFEALHSITFKNDATAKLLAILPNRDDAVLTILSDGTFHIWKRSKESHESPFLTASYLGYEFMMEKGLTCLEFTPDGRTMALAGKNKFISLVDVAKDYWSLNRLVELPQTANEVKDMKFIDLPVWFLPAGKVKTLCLAVFTLPNYELLLYDIEGNQDGSNRICRLIDIEFDPRQFQLMGPNNSYAVFQTSNGFVDVYTTFWWLNDNFCPWLHYERKLSELGPPVPRKVRGPAEREWTHPREVWATRRGIYRHVLRQLERIPPAERCAYWRLGLEAPGNETAFRELVARDLHPAARRLPGTLTSLPKGNLFSLTRLYSALCYVSPLFFLLEFHNTLLHFCRTLTWSSMSVFEIVVTIMNNYCRDWFTEYPNPSENLLNTIEPLIAKKDPKLAAHFTKFGISPVKIAWTLMCNLFTNALLDADWATLWDHIIFADRSYVINVVVSLILNSRCVFFQIETDKQLVDFEKAIKTSDLNIGSVILVAHDLLFLEKDHIQSDNDGFQPLKKGDYYKCLFVQLDESSITKAVHSKMDTQKINDTCLQNKIDLFNLLDPRPHHRIIRSSFSKEYAKHSSLTVKPARLEESNKSLEEQNRAREEEILFEIIESDRVKKFQHLQKLLEDRELFWISNQKKRFSDRARLELFERVWPKDGRTNVICTRHGQYDNVLLLRDKRVSSRLQRISKSLKYSLSGKEKSPVKSPEADETGVISGAPDIPDTPQGAAMDESPVRSSGEEYLDSYLSLKAGLVELTAGTENLLAKVEAARQEARHNRPRGEAGPRRPQEVGSPRAPQQKTAPDWRAARREEFQALLEELYQRIAAKKQKDTGV